MYINDICKNGAKIITVDDMNIFRLALHGFNRKGGHFIVNSFFEGGNTYIYFYSKLRLIALAA